MSLLKVAAVYARSLIANEEHWTQEVNARNAQGEPVSIHNDEACCWCAFGAVDVACKALAESYTEQEHLFSNLLAALEDQWGNLAEVNDEEGHAAVLAVFDRVIESCEVKA